MADPWEDAAKEVKGAPPTSGGVFAPSSTAPSGDPWESAAKEVGASSQSTSRPSPTFMDRISTEMNQGGAALEPDKVASSLRDSLSRSVQAYSRLHGGGGPQFSDVIDSVPLIGPMAHDAYTKLTTPGHRIEGLTDFGMMALPELAEHGPAITESMGRPMSVTGGALRGGGRAAITPIDFKGIPVPASLAGGGMGSLAGYPFGTVGRVVGAGVGAALPFVRGAVEGGRRAGELFDLNRAPMPESRPAFQGHDFTPPVFSTEAPVGKPGAVLPSGSIVGPAAPSVTNPPPPRGLPPRTPLWERAGVSGTPNAGTPDAAPIYPASPVLESGHVIGPRPSLASEPNGGVVVNGQPPRMGPATGTVQIAAPSQVTPIQPASVPASGGSVFSNSSPHAGPSGVSRTVGTQAEMMRQQRLSAAPPVKSNIVAPQGVTGGRPVISQPDLDVLNQQLRDSLKARGVPVRDTPASVRERANTSRAKFNENGNRNQLKK